MENPKKITKMQLQSNVALATLAKATREIQCEFKT